MDPASSLERKQFWQLSYPHYVPDYVELLQVGNATARPN